MRADTFSRFQQGESAEQYFDEQTAQGGKVLIQLVYSCGEDSVAIIDRISSPVYNPEFGRYCFPFTVATELGRNTATPANFVIAKAKDTFWGGRKLPIAEEDVESVGIYQFLMNRGEHTLFLPYAVHIDLDVDHRYLATSNKFIERNVGEILWLGTEEARDLLAKEHEQKQRGSTAGELGIIDEYIELMTELVPVEIVGAMQAQHLAS